MDIQITEENGTNFALINSDDIVIRDAQDALDLLANCSYQGASKMIIHKEHITPQFFDLKTGLAGDVLQKFSNYGTQLAIVGDFSGYTSKSLKDFIYESNKGRRIVFVGTVEEAKEKLNNK